MNWIRKMFKSEDNDLMQMLYQMLNSNLPIWVGDNLKEYITKGYAYNDLIYSIIRLKQDIAKSIEWLPYKIVDEKALKGFHYHTKAYKAGINPQRNMMLAHKFRQKALEETDDPLAYNLISSINSEQSLRDLVEEYFGWLDLVGNFYLYANMNDGGKIASSFHVPPAHEVEIIAGTWMNPVRGYKIKHYMGDKVIEKNEVLHIKNWNPDYSQDGRQLYGMSPLKAGARVLTLDNAGIDTSTSSFQNSGIRGIIHGLAQKDLGSNFTPEQATMIKKKIESWTGTKNANRIVGTNAPVGYTEIGKSPVDLGVLSAMDKNVMRLCNLFQTPVELFLPGTTFSNKMEARKNLITAGILPKMEILKEKYNQFAVEPLNAYYKKNYYIDYDLFSIVELQDDLNNIANMYKGIDWVTINEKREAMNYGVYENEAADLIYADPFKMPLGINEITNEDIDKRLAMHNSSVY